MDSLLQMLFHSVKRFGPRSALWDPKEMNGYNVWTYEELWRDVQRIAGHLADLGVQPGDTMGLISENRAWWPIFDFAIMSLGATTVPIYPNLPVNQVDYLMAHSQMKGAIVQDAGQLHKVTAAHYASNLAFITVCDAKLVDQSTDTEPCPIFDFEDWIKSEPMYGPDAWIARWQQLKPDYIASIVYTSGTTGSPKGVLLTHGNLVSNLEGISQILRLEPTYRTLSYLPLSHIFERTAGQFFPLFCGASVVYSRGVAHIRDELSTIQPDLLSTVPRLLDKVYEQVMSHISSASPLRQSLFRAALRHGERVHLEHQPASSWMTDFYDKMVFQKIRQALGGHLKMAVVGGAALPAHVARFFVSAGLPVFEGYGLTETSPVIAVNPPDSVRIGTVGIPLPNIEVRLEGDGEIVVRGPSISPGYYHDEAATQRAFDGDGWFRTGDIGEFTADGYLRITDRKKNVIVLETGKKVVPTPIESAMVQSRFIDEALLIGHGQKFVAAIVVPAEGTVRAWLTERGRGSLAREDWVKDAQVIELLTTEMKQFTADFARFEQPKRLIVSEVPFTVENGLLTPSLKVRGRQVVERYERQMTALYSAPMD